MPPRPGRVAGSRARAQPAAPPTPPATSPQPEPSERVIAWRVGLIGAIAALLGAAIGGGGSYIAAREQSTTQMLLAQRQSRESAYQALLTSADAAYGKLGWVITSSKLSTDERLQKVNEHVRDVVAATRDLENKVNLVVILGSSDVAEKAQRLQRAFRACVTADVLANNFPKVEEYRTQLGKTQADVLGLVVGLPHYMREDLSA